MIEIAEAKAQDVSAIIELWKELMDFHIALNPFYTLSEDARERFEEFLRQNIASPDCLVLAARDDSAVVGYCLSFVAHHPPVLKLQRHGFISDIAVTKRYRGRGIGTAMAGRVREWFADRGITRIELRVSAFNAAGRPFWEKQGFTEYEAVMCLDTDTQGDWSK
ncbi:MAG: GNAT family N-acetyltransferase [Deltaproteobacteria bacterium]|nr:GNAT family N-acetyltransferase [Candidatus Zymogenaceae bacterium]